MLILLYSWLPDIHMRQTFRFSQSLTSLKLVKYIRERFSKWTQNFRFGYETPQRSPILTLSGN